MKHLQRLLFFLFVIPIFVLAAADQTEVDVTVTGNPPSIPTSVVATPISSSRIDLTWATSTDDSEVSGYQVFRDNSQVATSTFAAYSDTGLTASTTYSYNITAFDLFLNTSARSATTSTSTLSADTTAPSVPTGLSATAVSSSQINLNWTASTDDTAVTGYQVFRDNVQIDTSSGTTYSDTGLSAQTSYSYNVTAFDAANNISARSATSTATTNAASSGGGGGGGGGGFNPASDITAPFIIDIRIAPGITEAIIFWETDEPALSTLRWGRTPDYDDGSLVESVFTISHETELLGLVADTLYYFQIVVEDGQRNKRVYDQLTFRTSAGFDDEPPANVRNLEADLAPGTDDDTVTLIWENPLDPDFEAVRVLRSDRFYPKDPFDGEIVYDGPQPEAIDITEKGIVYFYTVFTRDEAGNYSSGAIVRPRVPGEPPPDIVPDIDIPQTTDPEIQKLSLLDFDFIQEKDVTTFVGDQIINIDSSKDVTISVDYNKVPEVLKTIIITLTDPEDASKQFSFLLRTDKDKKVYEANVGPLGKSGAYPVEITIFDFKNQGVKQIAGILNAKLSGVIGVQELGISDINLVWIFLALVALYLWYLRIIHLRGY